MSSLKNVHAAIIHHWFLTMAGGEKVCEAICELFDAPDLCAIVADPTCLGPTLRKSKLRTSFIQRFPGSKKHYRYYAALFPLAIESFDFSPYELVISSDSSVTKGVITQPDTCHICFCHSPMRYAWNAFYDYSRELGTIKQGMMALMIHYLRLFDYSASSRVDYFAAPSETSRKRIKKIYRREATVIHPPCDVDRFEPSNRIDDYYLIVGRLVNYKRTDLAVKAFSQNRKRLLIVGTGPQMKDLKSMASNNIEFLGWMADPELSQLYSRCKALIFPGEEDFGIVPVEAQAAGRPVIAFGKGGAMETVIPNQTGLFFYEKTVDSLNHAIKDFENSIDQFDTDKIVVNAARFSKERFLKSFGNFVSRCLDEHRREFTL